MPKKFIGCDRDQAMLMPLSLLDWVPEDHLVWTILGAVDGMDLGAFYAAYRADGHGRPAYEPRMMVALTGVAGLLMAAAAAESAPHERKARFAARLPEPAAAAPTASQSSSDVLAGVLAPS
jgi:hypothetical protein